MAPRVSTAKRRQSSHTGDSTKATPGSNRGGTPSPQAPRSAKKLKIFHYFGGPAASTPAESPGSAGEASSTGVPPGVSSRGRPGLGGPASGVPGSSDRGERVGGSPRAGTGDSGAEAGKASGKGLLFRENVVVLVRPTVGDGAARYLSATPRRRPTTMLLVLFARCSDDMPLVFAVGA